MTKDNYRINGSKSEGEIKKRGKIPILCSLHGFFGGDILSIGEEDGEKYISSECPTCGNTCYTSYPKDRRERILYESILALKVKDGKLQGDKKMIKKLIEI